MHKDMNKVSIQSQDKDIKIWARDWWDRAIRSIYSGSAFKAYIHSSG